MHAEIGAPVMESLAALYTQAPVHTLMTVPAADCFGARPNGQYLGVRPLGIATVPVVARGERDRGFLATW